ncbi:intracellular coagulation inhibitor 1 [Rhipicephalus sanguineus]|uniref:intracellular coagulation inhibitor 1 n=1 Tax=Rhipicephalus sanguineus TaxID=34632 RepID=UPI0018942A68|nr:intracellular coagulation inhibitor 1 [Rhipicephalus sanguineus]
MSIPSSSPYHPRSNGTAERELQVSKKLLKKYPFGCVDLCNSLLEWRNFPRDKCLKSPSQRLMGRLTRILLPVPATHMKPRTLQPNFVLKQLLNIRRKQRTFYNRGSKPPPELPLEWTGSEFSLVVLLPDDKNGLASLEAKLSALTALRCFSSLRRHGQVRVSLPLFKVKQVTELSPALSALGVRDVFGEHALLWGSSMGDKRVTLMRHAAAFETSQNGGRRRSRTKQRQSHLARLTRSIGVLLRMPRFRTDVISVDRPFAFFVTCSRPDAVMLLGSVREIRW